MKYYISLLLLIVALPVAAVEELLPAPSVVEVITERPTSTSPRTSFEYKPVAPTADALLDTTVTPSEFNISRTLILPGSKLYFIKQGIRRAVLKLTKKKNLAKKQLVYANRMLFEAWTLVSSSNDIRAIQDAVLGVLQESAALVPDELPYDRLLRRPFRAQLIIDNIVARLSPDLRDAVYASQENAVKALKEASDGEIVAMVGRHGGSVFKYFKSVELVRELNRPDAEPDLLAKLKTALETSPIQTREQFDDYVLGLPGNPLRHFMIVDALRATQEFAPDFVTQLDILKGKLAVKIVKTYDALPSSDNSLLREHFLEPLLDGSYFASRAGVQLEQYASGELKTKTHDAINIIRKNYDVNALRSVAFSIVGDPDVVDLATYDQIDFPAGVERAVIRMAERIGKEGYGFSGRFADPALLDGVEVLKRLRARYPSFVGSFNRAIEVQEAKEAEFRAALTDG